MNLLNMYSHSHPYRHYFYYAMDIQDDYRKYKKKNKLAISLFLLISNHFICTIR